ncbi:MAG TPA: hypothetical protein VII49_03425 [Rhizomicrobium sp.]
MKYGIDFRILKKGATSSVDNTTMARPVDVEVDETCFALVPNVGDFVDMEGETDFRNVAVHGKVRCRLFRYMLGYCYVTIVVEESEEEWTRAGI